MGKAEKDGPYLVRDNIAILLHEMIEAADASVPESSVAFPAV